MLRERAIALRLAGKSLREIKQILGPMSNSTLHAALKGTPPPDWTRRPNAKDELKAQARELRGQGLDYSEIATRLRVSKSSVSLWVRDLPVPERLSYEECRKRAAEGIHRYWEIPGHRWSQPGGPGSPRLHPRERRLRGRTAVLARPHAHPVRPVPAPGAEAPQPEDCADERQ